MKRLSKNALSIISSDIARRLLGFFAVAFLARRVGTAGFGAVNIGFTVLSYALIFISIGLPTLGIREIARGEGAHVVNKIISVRMVLAFGVFIIVTAIAQITINNKTTAGLITIFCLSVFANATLLDWFFQGRERMGIIGASRIVSAAVYLLFIVLFVHSIKNILWVAIGSVIGDFFATIILLNVYSRRHGAQLLFDLSSGKTLILQSLPIGIGSIMAHVGVNLAPIVIGIAMTNADVGIYSAASKLVFFLLMFDRVLATLLLPAATRFHSSAPDEFAIILNSATKFIVMVALPLSVGGTLMARQIITLVFGAQYVEAGVVFQILIWYFFVTMIHTIFTSALIAIGQEKLYGKLMAISALLYFIFVTAFILIWGIKGSALAVVSAEAVTLAMMWYHFHKYEKIFLGKYLFKSLPAVLAMGIVLYLLPSYHVLILVGLGALVYLFVLFISRAATMNDVRELMEYI